MDPGQAVAWAEHGPAPAVPAGAAGPALDEAQSPYHGRQNVEPKLADRVPPQTAVWALRQARFAREGHRPVFLPHCPTLQKKTPWVTLASGTAAVTLLAQLSPPFPPPVMSSPCSQS